jgi:hypothetical protein
MQKSPPVSLPTAPASLHQATGSSRSPTPGAARRRALGKASPPKRRRAGSRAPLQESRVAGNYPPREARGRGRRRRRTSSGRPEERGRENTSLQSSPPGELVTAPPSVARRRSSAAPRPRALPGATAARVVPPCCRLAGRAHPRTAAPRPRRPRAAAPRAAHPCDSARSSAASLLPLLLVAFHRRTGEAAASAPPRLRRGDGAGGGTSGAPQGCVQ